MSAGYGNLSTMTDLGPYCDWCGEPLTMQRATLALMRGMICVVDRNGERVTAFIPDPDTGIEPVTLSNGQLVFTGTGNRPWFMTDCMHDTCYRHWISGGDDCESDPEDPLEYTEDCEDHL